MYVAFDLETTGIDPFNDRPVSYALIGPNYRLGNLINPGMLIPIEATNIHGITDDLVTLGQPIDEAIEFIVDALHTLWDEDAVLVGMNLSYDLTMIASLCKKLSLGFEVGAVADVLVIDRHFDKWRSGSRNLTSLCEFYSVPLTDAHSADADSEACLMLLFKMSKRYQLPVFSKDNHTLRSWYQEWLRSYSSYQVKQGKEPIPLGRYEWPIHKEDNGTS